MSRNLAAASPAERSLDLLLHPPCTVGIVKPRGLPAALRRGLLEVNAAASREGDGTSLC